MVKRNNPRQHNLIAPKIEVFDSNLITKSVFSFLFLPQSYKIYSIKIKNLPSLLKEKPFSPLRRHQNNSLPLTKNLFITILNHFVLRKILLLYSHFPEFYLTAILL